MVGNAVYFVPNCNSGNGSLRRKIRERGIPRRASTSARPQPSTSALPAAPPPSSAVHSPFDPSTPSTTPSPPTTISPPQPARPQPSTSVPCVPSKSKIF